MISYEEPTVEVLAMHNIASVSIVTSRASRPCFPQDIYAVFQRVIVLAILST